MHTRSFEDKHILQMISYRELGIALLLEYYVCACVRGGRHEGVRASVSACVCLLVYNNYVCMRDCVILHFVL